MLKSIPFSQRTSGRPFQCWSSPLFRCGTYYFKSVHIVKRFVSPSCRCLFFV
nr:MAG TPA: hypothetical protein [Caudoviricetes sp.]